MIADPVFDASPGDESTPPGVPGAAAPTRLAWWNALPPDQAAEALLPCCGSRGWARALVQCRPLASQGELLEASDRIWSSLTRQDWQQAFDAHPRLGEQHARSATAASLAWSAEEQRNAGPSEALQRANARYETKFGHIFLLYADGKAAAEILEELERRMHNDAEDEWREAGEQQRQITRIRLVRWLSENSA